MKAKTSKPNNARNLFKKFTALELILLAIVTASLLVAGSLKAVQYRNQSRNPISSTEKAVSDKLAEVTSTLNLVPGTVDVSINTPQPTNDTPTKPDASKPTPSSSQTTTPSGNSAPATSSPNNPVGGGSPTSPVDGDTPQVTLTYPSYWGQTVSGVINITATASDSSGINRVVFMIRKIGQATPVYSYADYTAPYGIAFDTTVLPNGGSDYTVEAQAFDNAGKGNLASHRINIQN